MKVEWVYSGPHPVAGMWIGCVTVDDPDAFELWLERSCPNHKIVQYRRRSDSSVACGGQRWRINIHDANPAEQLLFKLTWYEKVRDDGL